MTWIPFIILSLAAAAFVWRLLAGPSVPDRVIALDGLLATVTSGILIAAAASESSVAIIAVGLLVLVGIASLGLHLFSRKLAMPGLRVALEDH